MDKKRKNIILAFIAIILGFFMALLDTTIVNISLPQMSEYFNSSLNDITWVSNIYNIVLLVFMLSASRIADQFGRKRLFILGIAVFTIISCIIGLSSNLMTIIILRALQGIAAAIIIPVTIPIILLIIPEEKFGVVIGLWGALAGLAAACGPVLGGILTQLYNWKAVFFVNLPFGIISLILSGVVLEESYDDTSSKQIDWGGIITSSLSILTVTLGLIQGPDKGWTSKYILLLFAVSIISLILFIKIELTCKEPMLPLWLVKMRNFSASSIVIIFATAGLMAGSFLVPFYLNKILGMSQKLSGMTVMFMPVAMIVVSIIAGPLSQKFGSKIFAIIGLSVVAISLYLLGTLQLNSQRIDIIWRLTIAGIGLGMTISPVMGGAIQTVPKEKTGIASAVTNAARTFGMVLGVAILTTILNNNVNKEVINVSSEIEKRYINDAQISENTKLEIKRDILNKENYNTGKDLENKLKLNNNEKKNVDEIYSNASVSIKQGDFESYMHTFKSFSLVICVGIIFAFLCKDKKKLAR